MPANQKRSALTLGFTPSAPGGFTGNFQLNAAANWLAMGFVPSESKTINTASLYGLSVAGTLGSTDLSCDVYSDTAGTPNASLGSTSTVGSTPTGAGWVRFSGLAVALTAGTQYWLVFKNANGTPASNNITYSFGQQNTSPMLPNSGVATLYGWLKRSSTNSGGTWGGAVTTVSGIRLGYSDSSYDGLPTQSIAAAASTDRAYGSRELGVKFTSYANATIEVRGLALYVGENGTPSGSLRYRLYTGSGGSPTLQGTTYSIAQTNVGTGGYLAAYFPSTIAIPPATVVRCTMGTTTGGDASNSYFGSAVYTIDSDANSLALLPFGGTLQMTFFDGAAWDDTQTNLLIPFSLLPDTTGEFGASGGGGGLLVHPGMSGGMRG
jgi:hypothetical protein